MHLTFGEKIAIALTLFALFVGVPSLVGTGVNMLNPGLISLAWWLIGTGVLTFVVAIVGTFLLALHHFKWSLDALVAGFWRRKGLISFLACISVLCLAGPFAIAELYGKNPTIINVSKVASSQDILKPTRPKMPDNYVEVISNFPDLKFGSPARISSGQVILEGQIINHSDIVIKIEGIHLAFATVVDDLSYPQVIAKSKLICSLSKPFIDEKNTALLFANPFGIPDDKVIIDPVIQYVGFTSLKIDNVVNTSGLFDIEVKASKFYTVTFAIPKLDWKKTKYLVLCPAFVMLDKQNFNDVGLINTGLLLGTKSGNASTAQFPTTIFTTEMDHK